VETLIEAVRSLDTAQNLKDLVSVLSTNLVSDLGEKR
jgi:hypothetical protein